MTTIKHMFLGAWMVGCMTCGAVPVSVVSFTASEPDENGAIELTWCLTGWQDPASVYPRMRYNVAVFRMEASDWGNVLVLPLSIKDQRNDVRGSYVDPGPHTPGETYYYWLACAPYDASRYYYNFASLYLSGYSDGGGVAGGTIQILNYSLTSVSDPVAVTMPEPVKVTFHANGGIGEMEPQEFLPGDAKELSKNLFKREGFEFEGWAVGSPNGGVKYRDMQYVGIGFGIESDTDLYAVWMEKDFVYDLKATTDLIEAIELTWNARDGHAGEKYIIYRSLDPSADFKEVERELLTTSYTDRSCLPGVNYYYYLKAIEGPDGIEGPKSKAVLGKKAVDEFDPCFDLELIGSDRPEEKGAKGSSGETHVLVAGCEFTCKVKLKNYLPEVVHDVSIKYVKLVGKPLGGAASQVEHTIVCYSDDTFGPHPNENYVIGNFVESEGTFEFEARLEDGMGRHGKYEWTAFCEYEVDGTFCKRPVKGPKKNVYFEKDGTDNGMPNIVNSGNKVPNWYAYWKADGACPGLNHDRVLYRGDGAAAWNGGAANSYPHLIESERFVWLDRDVAKFWPPRPVVFNQTFMTWDGKRQVGGIYKVEDVVAHEWQHHETSKRYNIQTNINGEPDSDRDLYRCVVEGVNGEGERIAKSENNGRDWVAICDLIVDVDEIDDHFNLKQLFGPSFPGLYPNKTDSYDLEHKKGWMYNGYGDNELVSLVAGRRGMYNANPSVDWAYPGEIAGGIPLLASPTASSGKGLKAMDANSGRDLKNTLTEESSGTNIIITLNSISVDTLMDGSCITGIVYAIGTTIQSDITVIFEGYMYDVESNVVATAHTLVSPDTTSVELFFDAKDIFENSTSGPYTLGRVVIRLDTNNTDDNIINELYDFAIAPIDIDRSMLRCDKGRVVSSAIDEVTTTGVVASASVQINVEGNYRLSAELVTTNGDLVAVTGVSNHCVVGVNEFNLAFSGDSIYQRGRCGIYAMRNLQLRSDNEFVAAYAGPVELPDIYDFTYFAPQGVHVVIDPTSGIFSEPTVTASGNLSALKFAFEATNSDNATACYDMTSFLVGTNSEIVAVMVSPIAISNGVNRIEITVPASTIASAGIDGPYRFESIELLPRSGNILGTTYRPTVISRGYKASDFSSAAIAQCGPSRLGDASGDGKLSFECPYNALRIGRITAEVVLVDKNGDFAAQVIKVDDIAEVGAKTCTVNVARGDITGVDAGEPYAVASFALRPDILGELPIYVDTTSLTNIFWPPAIPFPEIADDAKPEEVAATLSGMADANLAVNLTNAAQYAEYRAWALALTNEMVSAQAVKDSPRAWLSYALGVNQLIDAAITSNDLRIVSFRVHEINESGTATARTLNFTFEVAIDGVEIGSGSVAEETLKANLKKILGLEGSTALTPSTFSSDNIEITFEKPVDGKAKFSATPSHDVGNTFFMRVKVKGVQ